MHVDVVFVIETPYSAGRNRSFQNGQQRTRLRMRTFLLLLLLTLGVVPGKAAEVFPTRPIKVIVAFGPQSPTYIAARITADRMSEQLGVPVIVEAQTGGAGVIAATMLKNAAPDGYTLGMLSSVHAIRLSLMKNPPYVPADFAGVTGFSQFANVIAVDSRSSDRTLVALLARARAHPSGLSIATTPAGSAPHLAALLLNKAAAVSLVPIYYEKVGDMLLGMKRGDTAVIIQPFAALQSGIVGGELLPLAVTAKKRVAYLPDTPTTAEAGLPTYPEVVTWNGLFVPAGTSPEVIERLNRAIVLILKDPAIEKRFVQLGIEPAPSSARDVEELLQSDADRWSHVIREAGIAAQ